MGKLLWIAALVGSLGFQVGCTKKRDSQSSGADRQKKAAAHQKQAQEASAKEAKAKTDAAEKAEREALQAKKDQDCKDPSPTSKAGASQVKPAAPAPETSLERAKVDEKKPESKATAGSPGQIPVVTSHDSGKAKPASGKTEDSKGDHKKADVESKASSEIKDKKWSFKDAKVINSGPLDSIRKDGLLVLADGSLRTPERATMEQANVGQGLQCVVETKETLKTGTLLKSMSVVSKQDPKDRVVELLTLQFKTETGGEVLFLCKARGEIEARHFIENFEGVLVFQNEKGEFESDNKESQDPRVIDSMSRNFKVLDIETLQKVFVEDKAEGLAIAEGKLVSAKQANSDVYNRKLRAACQISDHRGDIKKDVLYTRVDTTIVSNDESHGVAIMNYIYTKKDSEDFIGITCILRRNTPTSFFFQTFKGVLAFEKAP